MNRRRIQSLVGAFAALAVASMLVGCYEHVTKAGVTATEVKQRYEPAGEAEGPSILNELMWGTPPKGEDPVKYYRRKNSFGIQQ